MADSSVSIAKKPYAISFAAKKRKNSILPLKTTSSRKVGKKALNPSVPHKTLYVKECE